MSRNDDISNGAKAEGDVATNRHPDRLTQPVDTESPPRLAFPVVGIGASAGGLEAFSDLLKALRPDTNMAFVLIQHLPPDRESLIADILSHRTEMKVLQVEDGMVVQANYVYVIRPGHTLTIHDGAFHLGVRLEKPGHSRPVDDFFKSLAEEQRERGICIIMSGMGSNGTAGAQAIKAVGGLCIAQDPDTAQFPSMPRHLIEAGYADYILAPQDIPDVLLSYADHPYARGGRENAGHLQARDQQSLREVVAILRTRTRQDFNGYKKPTILRRVQRRMGLNRVTTIPEYTKILRQSPAEVSALADDLLIHVTGFFRDPRVWEQLRQRVIVPLIAARDSDSSIRCWITACSSGEEAYTLAMLLVEEAARVEKRLDIRVFATDMAERSLHNARQGVFPGGIESEISPARLERFFQKEDEVYRVRPELRERVVFAPQNVLQDPPFSRLDIVTCRNLLIYLEPDMQRRLLSLLHFSLREGGTLVLGTSETIAGVEELFEPLDKAHRIFRRVGPTRHGTIDFPLPHAMASPEGERPDNRITPRPSLTALTTRALLEHHMPAAVTVDRDFRIVFFHGSTDLFLNQPRGEATRDLFAMLHDSVRAATRTALHRAASTGQSVTVTDGAVIFEDDRRHRVAVTASPLDLKLAPEYLVVSFQPRGEIPAEEGQPRNGDASDESDLAASELLRIRDELQSTIEELQTSNEELKASHEEVVSMNEEFQSTNEELETSREEMQSLNEELTTVNAQLQAKMDEHQAARNDLTSLLTSTDIAVLFLDRQFRIRRFTPAMKDLLEMIQSDLGRPLSDLAQKFSDPELLNDCENVLEKLLPVDREIEANGSRWFTRRVLPYRTIDNRIDGVVITFADVTERKRSEGERTELLKRERDARVEAESANRIKDEFLATVSHELRTPISAVLLWANLLSDPRTQQKNLTDGLAAIKASALSQAALIDDLLDTSRILSGTLRLQPQNVDVVKLIDQLIETARPMAHRKKLQLRTEFSSDVGSFVADAERLRQILWNLLNNAIKFTSPGGSVDIAMRRIGDEIEFQVSDTGIGITPEFLPFVFDRFRQADPATTRRYGGLGLGLGITRQLVELHHGQIEAHSAGRGKGATFTVRLPLSALLNTRVEPRFSVSRTSRETVDLSGCRILVIEDDALTGRAIEALLISAGAAVTLVSSAEAARSAIGSARPNLIISDIGLPDEDGYALLRAQRAAEQAAGMPPIPAIALTAFAQEQDRARTADAGFQLHLAKPITADELLPIVRTLLALD